jgi:hypothetical protein
MLQSLSLNYKRWIRHADLKSNKKHDKNSDICPYIHLSLSTRIGADSP